MSTVDYSSLINKAGSAYSQNSIVSKSYYNTPILEEGRELRGNSRRSGDANPEVQKKVIQILIDTARRHGLNDRETALILAIAKHESGFNPDAAAGTTSAHGIGQFVNDTGTAHGLNDKNRWDVHEQARALVEHFKYNQNIAVKRNQGEEYIYKYHHDGSTRDYGGIKISQKYVMPLVDSIEQIVKMVPKDQTAYQIAELRTKPNTSRPSNWLSTLYAEMREGASGLAGWVTAKIEKMLDDKSLTGTQTTTSTQQTWTFSNGVKIITDYVKNVKTWIWDDEQGATVETKIDAKNTTTVTEKSKGGAVLKSTSYKPVTQNRVVVTGLKAEENNYHIDFLPFGGTEGHLLRTQTDNKTGVVTAQLTDQAGKNILNYAAGETLVRHPDTGVFIVKRVNGEKTFLDPVTGTRIVQQADGAGHIIKREGDVPISFVAGALSANSDGSIVIHQSNNQAPLTFFTTQSTFTLSVKNNLSTTQEAVKDLIAVANQVSQGLVTSGGSWALRFDSNRLNNDQYYGLKVDNTAAAAQTQILADNWRPGNGNAVAPVIDYSLATQVSGWGLKPPSNALIGSSLNQANTFARTTLPTDPLVLDLNGDGVKLTAYAIDPVLFDTDNDGGSLEQTGWVSADDGLVVVDRNGNGHIDNMSEVLSEYYAGATGIDGNGGEKRYKNGFIALKSLDSNDDNVFDAKDTTWENVQIWRDANHDGKTDAGELSSLNALGITQINLSNLAQSGEVRDGNEVLAWGSFVQNGQVKEAIAANFLSNPNGSTITKSTHGTVITTQAGGKVGPTSAYVTGDSAGEIIDVANKGVRNAVGATGNDTLIGDANNNWLSGGQGSDTFYAGAGDDVLLIDADDRQENIFGGEGIDVVQVVGEHGMTLNLAQAEVEVAQGGRGDDTFIAGGRESVYIRGGDGDDVLIGGSANDALSGENGDDLIDGGAGNDVLRGHRGRDQLFGGEGDDLLDGGLGDDQLQGGLGDDVLKGGAGDDVIDGGDGEDAIELQGSYADYRIMRAADGIWISDTVAGRDGTDFVRNVERANFLDVSRVEIPSNNSIGLENPLPVKEVLTRNKLGQVFNRTASHLIGKEQLLANDIDWQNDGLRITELFDVTGGVATITEEGDVLFTPNAQFTGFMGFKYTVADAKGNIAATATNNATGEEAVMRASVYLKTPDLPVDPLVTDQWYLNDSHILPVWKDYSGKGIRIGQFETSGSFGTTKEILDYRHIDLKDNIDPQWLANANSGQLAGEGSEGKLSDHATLVAGVMVASKNGLGGVGIAYDAVVAGHWLNGSDFTSFDNMQRYDVINHSWGILNSFGGKFDGKSNLPHEYRAAIELGRKGLGSVIVTAGGNSRNTGGNTNYSNVSNTYASIIVGAINAQSDLSSLQLGSKPFSSPGASILVSAPGSNVTSTSRLVHTENGSIFGSDSSVTQGTSFATPIVSGIVALILEANPHLGYRDVQQILALSARKINDVNTAWETNGSQYWNGGGMHISHDYGYGSVDARAAVRLAETWIAQETFANLFCSEVYSGELNYLIPDGDSAGMQHTLTVSDTSMLIEHTQVRIGLKHARPGDLIVSLISPSGTESVLMNRPGKAPGSDASDRGAANFNGSDTLDFIFSTALLRGESANGNWTLKVVDAVAGDTGILTHWSVDVYGAKKTVSDQYIYTDEFAQLAAHENRRILQDRNGGYDTINVAAINSSTHIDLKIGSAIIAGATLTIQNPAEIENIVSGEFDDTLIGNDASNLLVGGRGNDSLSGGAGNDFLFGGHGNDVLIGGADADFFIIEKGLSGTDTLHDFVIGEDKIVLLGYRSAAIQMTQHGSDVQLKLNDGQILIVKNTRISALGLGSIITTEKIVSAREFSGAKRVAFANDDDQNVDLSNISLTVFLGAGDDVIVGGPADDVLYGDAGNDVLHGSAGNDVLQGGTGLDILDGGEGDDLLILEADDALDKHPLALSHLTGDLDLSVDALIAAKAIGSSGADRFIIEEDLSAQASLGLMKNLIIDFETNNPKEKIDLSKIRSILSFSQLNFNVLTYHGERYLRVWLGIAQPGTQYFTLKNVTQAQLSAENFIFSNPDLLPDLALSTRVLIKGTPENDTLVGDAGGNTLDGAAGEDMMEGRLGDDTYIVDSINDKVVEVAGGGFDTVKSSVNYALDEEVEVLILTGSRNLHATGNALPNRLFGNSGNNLLDGKAGVDLMSGGAGHDTYIVDDSADMVIELEREGIDTVNSAVSFTLGKNIENLTLVGKEAINGTGNELDNRLIGNSANNNLLGWAGNDILDGGAGIDTLIGGSGDDIYIVDSEHDVVFERTNEGRDTVQSSVSWTLGANLENLTLIGKDAINGTGNEQDNVLVGNKAFNRLSGGRGNDTYIVDQAKDELVENPDEGIDTIQASIHYTLKEHFENLTLVGNANLRGIGNASNNIIVGNAGNNYLIGGGGSNTISGGAGHDVIDCTERICEEVSNRVTVVTEHGRNTLSGGDGNDMLLAGNAGDTLNGDAGNDDLTGGKGNDVLNGGSGNDLILGGARDDVIDGGAGNDQLDGEAGIDTYLMRRGMGRDVITPVFFLDPSHGAVPEDEWEESELFNLCSHGTYTSPRLEESDDAEDNQELEETVDAEDIIKIVGIKPDEIEVTRYIYDKEFFFDDAYLYLAIRGTDEGLGIKRFFSSPLPARKSAKSYRVEFNDGTIWTDQDLRQKSIRGATVGNDHLYGDHFSINSNDVINGLSGDDQIYGYGGDDRLSGDEGDDLLKGGEGNDILHGGSENDYLEGGGGDDLLHGGSGNDRLSDILGNNILFGDSGNDTLTVEYGGNNFLDGGDGDDILMGGAGKDILVGGAGKDQLSGGGGDDILLLDGDEGEIYPNGEAPYYNSGIRSGGAGKDIFCATHHRGSRMLGLRGSAIVATNVIVDFDVAEDKIDLSQLSWITGFNQLQIFELKVFNQGKFTRILAEKGDQLLVINLYGTAPESLTPEQFIFFGSAHATVLDFSSLGIVSSNGFVWDSINYKSVNYELATDKANTLYALTDGNDTLLGGEGDDTYVVDSETAVIIENRHEGNDTVQSSASLTLGVNLENLTLIGYEEINATGNDLNNIIRGNHRANQLEGGKGSDVLYGGGGNDTYLFGKGDGQDIIVGNYESGSDPTSVLQFKQGILSSEVVVSQISDDLVLSISNTDDNVTIIAYFYSSLFAPIHQVRFADGTVWDRAVLTSKAQETRPRSMFKYGVSGTPSADILEGSAEYEWIDGKAGNDILRGNAGNDHLQGGDGDDVLDGGRGNDILRGGQGSDTYLFGRDGGRDEVILDDANDKVIFGTGITTEQLWFRKNWLDLDIGLIGTQDTLKLRGWFATNRMNERIDSFETADGKVLGKAQVDTLVEAMSRFAPPAVGETTLPFDYQSALAPIITASWR